MMTYLEADYPLFDVTALFLNKHDTHSFFTLLLNPHLEISNPHYQTEFYISNPIRRIP